ncbi:MAG: DUF3352 domain-containing protein [Bacteroidales bacterium]|nr:DUF3352 domain-containing protein [Bacteroidales bacterium]MBN2755549.1 DUF3352 domain-containing protein [Bacteroidales bacterium]
MKKFFKWFFVLIILIGISVGAWYVYDNYIAENNVRNDFSVVPADAVFVIETSNLSEAWTAISESNIWKHLLQNEHFKDINDYAVLLDDYLKRNTAIGLILKNREMLVSAHMISGVDYDFLFVIDLQTSKSISKAFNALDLVEGYKVKKRKFHEVEIIEFIDLNQPDSAIYFAVVDNLLIATFTGELIERAIDSKDSGFWKKNKQYQEVAGELSSNRLFKFYFNYKQLPNFLNIYADDMNEYSLALANLLVYSAFNMNLYNNRLSFDGFTVLDSLPSYLSALSDVKPGKISAYEIISNQTALYFSISFKSYNMLFQSLISQYATGNAKDMEDYSKNVNLIEKLLGINMQEDFFDWIGEEIAFVKLLPKNSARLEDVIVAVNAIDINNAKKGLNHITKQIRKRSPLKFDIINYKNFEINYLERKGFFKMFFGKLFEKLEKPYFTYIEDFVVFSNSLDALKEIIDDYLKGHTLSHKQSFMDFKDEFEQKSNITIFLQMPKLYSNIYTFSNDETKKSIKENKDLILSFNRIGFQLVSKGDLFKTIMIADYNEDAALYEELEKFEKKASDDLQKEQFDSLTFKIILEDSILKNDGPYRAYYADNKTIRFEGRITNHLLNNLWRSYYPSGNLKSSVNYKEGNVDGVAFFFYDDKNENKLAEINYENDLINGLYQEFYENGAQKANLNCEDGKLDGDAEFYYKTGSIKIKGKYKDNEKRGKWIFYDEKGNIINKERMKRNPSN